MQGVHPNQPPTHRAAAVRADEIEASTAAPKASRWSMARFALQPRRDQRSLPPARTVPLKSTCALLVVVGTSACAARLAPFVGVSPPEKPVNELWVGLTSPEPNVQTFAANLYSELSAPIQIAIKTLDDAQRSKGFESSVVRSSADGKSLILSEYAWSARTLPADLQGARIWPDWQQPDKSVLVRELKGQLFQIGPHWLIGTDGSAAWLVDATSPERSVRVAADWYDAARDKCLTLTAEGHWSLARDLSVSVGTLDRDGRPLTDKSFEVESRVRALATTWDGRAIAIEILGADSKPVVQVLNASTRKVLSERAGRLEGTRIDSVFLLLARQLWIGTLTAGTEDVAWSASELPREGHLVAISPQGGHVAWLGNTGENGFVPKFGDIEIRSTVSRPAQPPYPIPPVRFGVWLRAQSPIERQNVPTR